MSIQNETAAFISIEWMALIWISVANNYPFIQAQCYFLFFFPLYTHIIHVLFNLILATKIVFPFKLPVWMVMNSVLMKSHIHVDAVAVVDYMWRSWLCVITGNGMANVFFYLSIPFKKQLYFVTYSTASRFFSHSLIHRIDCMHLRVKYTV